MWHRTEQQQQEDFYFICLGLFGCRTLSIDKFTYLNINYENIWRFIIFYEDRQYPSLYILIPYQWDQMVVTTFWSHHYLALKFYLEICLVVILSQWKLFWWGARLAGWNKNLMWLTNQMFNGHNRDLWHYPHPLQKAYCL